MAKRASKKSSSTEAPALPSVEITMEGALRACLAAYRYLEANRGLVVIGQESLVNAEKVLAQLKPFAEEAAFLDMGWNK